MFSTAGGQRSTSSGAHSANRLNTARSSMPKMFSKDVLLPTMSTKQEKDLKRSIKEANRKSTDRKGLKEDQRKKIKSVNASKQKVNLNKTISN